ncbi:MAG: hypothetical protein OXQ29_22465 [Rhodospirillaceae bacterium]|nr:hypothetical protein [Rhodospirillaceae bacterium]
MSVIARIAVYFLLLAIGIPWYWPEDGGRIVLGLPAWVLAAVLAGLAAALYTAWCMRREHPP